MRWILNKIVFEMRRERIFVESPVVRRGPSIASPFSILAERRVRSASQSLQGEALDTVMLRCSVLACIVCCQEQELELFGAHCSFPRSTVSSILSPARLILSMIPKVLLLVEQIRSRTTQVYNLRTPIPILLQPRTFETVEGVRDALSPLPLASIRSSKNGRWDAYLSATDNTFILVVAKRAFVTDTDERCRAHVAIADGTLAVTFVA